MIEKASHLSKSALYLSYYRLQNLLHQKAPSFDEMLKAHQAEVHQKGYVVIEGYLDEALCAQIREEIDQIIEAHPATVWADKEGADHRIFGAERVSDAIRTHFYENEFLRQAIEGFYRAPTDFYLSMANRISAREENLGSGGGWHRDSVHSKQFKSIIYLNDVSEQGGPFQYLAGTQDYDSIYKTINQAGIGFAQNRFSEEEIETIAHLGDYQLVDLTAPAGSLILTDTFGIHRGRPIEAGTRYALTNYFFPEHMMNDKFRQKFEVLMIDREA